MQSLLITLIYLIPQANLDMRCVIILSCLALCACKATSKKAFVPEQRLTYSKQAAKPSCVEERINRQFISLTNKSHLVKSKETLPYDKRIDIKNVKYNLIESKLLKGASAFICDGGNKLRYLPLPNKGDVSLILVPMDCGDFDYRFYLLTIKNNTIISDRYVEGIWYEPGGPELEEVTSFKIDKNFSVKVKTTSAGAPQKIRNYIIRDDGKIVEK